MTLLFKQTKTILAEKNQGDKKPWIYTNHWIKYLFHVIIYDLKLLTSPSKGLLVRCQIKNKYGSINYFNKIVL